MNEGSTISYVKKTEAGMSCSDGIADDINFVLPAADEGVFLYIRAATAGILLPAATTLQTTILEKVLVSASTGSYL